MNARTTRTIMLANTTNTVSLAELRAIVEETYEWPEFSTVTVDQHSDLSITIIITQGDK